MSRAGFRGDRVCGSFFQEVKISDGTAERRTGRRWPVLRSPWGRPVKPSLAQTARSATPSTPSSSFAPHTPTRDARPPRPPHRRGQDQTRSLRALKRHISCDIFRRLNEIALTSEEASLTGVSVHPTHDRPCQASQGRFRSRVTAATTRRPSARRPIHRYRIGGGAGSVLASFPGPTSHAITHGAISSAYLPIAVCDFRRANARLA